MEEQVVEDVVQNDTVEGAVSEGVELPSAGETESSEVENVESPQNVVEAESAPQDVVDEKVEISKSEWDKMKSQVSQQEEFIQRRNNEVGDLRQQLGTLDQQRQQLSKTDDELNDLYIDNPAQAIREQNELGRVNEQMRYVQELETKASILHADPQFEDKVEEMAQLMVADGYDPASVQRFKSNPYWVDSATSMSYAKHVGQERRIKALETNNESLKQKPGEVARNIEAAAKGGVTLTASTGGTNGGEVVVTSEMVESMSSDQRKHFIKTGEVLIN